MNEERLISPQTDNEESSQERALRPKILKEYVGQNEVCEQMEIFIQAARSRNEALDHFTYSKLSKNLFAYKNV